MATHAGVMQIQRDHDYTWSGNAGTQTLSFNGRRFLLSPGDSYIFAGPSPWIDATAPAYGASTTSADNAAAINAALTAAAGNGVNGTETEVFLPPGVYFIKSPIYIPTKVVLRGASGFGTVIKAHASFVGSYMLYGGLNDGTSVFNNRCEDMILDCNNVAALSGYFSNQLNELCGLKRFNVFHYMDKGIYIQASGSVVGGGNWLLEDINLNAATAATGSYGIYCLATGGTGFGYGQINRCSVVPNGGAVVQTAGIYVGGNAAGDEMGVFCTDIHVEDATDGIHFDAQSHGFVNGITTSGGTVNAVTLDGFRPVTIENVRTTGGNCILDNRSSVTIPPFWWGVYAFGGTTAFSTQVQQLAFSAAASRIIPGATSLSIRNNASTVSNFTILDNGAAAFHPGAVVAGVTTLTVTPGAYTAVTAEVIDNLFDMHTMVITGGFATERFSLFKAPVISAATALTVVTAVTLDVEGAPTVAGVGPAAITNPIAFRVASGQALFAGASALSRPTVLINGAWITGGDTQTTMPHVLIADAITPGGTWSTAGTGLGVTAPNGFAGNVVDFQVNSTTVFRVTAAGAVIANTSGATATFNLVAAARATLNNLSPLVLNQAAGSGANNPIGINYVAGAHTALSIAEDNDVLFNLARTVQFNNAGSVLAAQRAVLINAPTYTAVSGTQHITQPATVAISGPPVASTNIAFDQVAVALWAAGAARFDGAITQGHAPAAINASATATAAQVVTGYITTSSSSAVAIQLPTGTALGTLLGAVQGTSFDLWFDNTASTSTGIVTVSTNTGMVLSALAAAEAGGSGLLTIPVGATGQACFRIMFSSATTATFTRVA